MTKSLIKNTFREIKNTKARFISIMAIIALGVGFFAGIKATVPSMYNLARTYTARSRQRVIKSATKSDLQNRRAIQILQPNLKPLNTRW